MVKFSLYLPRICFSLVVKGVILISLFSFQIQAQDKDNDVYEDAYVEKYVLGKGIRIFSLDDYFSLRLNINLQAFSETKIKSNREDVVNRFRIRRARLNLFGQAVRESLSYRLRVDLAQLNDGTGDGLYNGMLLDAFIAYRPISELKLTLGQRSTSTDNREMLIRSTGLQFVERSRLTSAFAAIREFGLFIDGRFKLPWGMRLKPRVSVTTGDGQNAFTQNYGGFKYGARIDFLPFGYFSSFGELNEIDFVREYKLKLVIGAIYSYNDGITSRRGRGSGVILYRDKQQNLILPGFGKAGIDFMLKWRAFTVVGEFVATHVVLSDGARACESAQQLNNCIVERSVNSGASYSTDFTRSVFNSDGSRGTPVNIGVENYINNQLFLGYGFNIQAGYLFINHFSIDLRYTLLATHSAHSFLNNTLFYNRPHYLTLGTSKYFVKEALKIQLSLTYAYASSDSRFAAGLNEENRQSLNADGEFYARVLFQVSI